MHVVWGELDIRIVVFAFAPFPSLRMIVSMYLLKPPLSPPAHLIICKSNYYQYRLKKVLFLIFFNPRWLGDKFCWYHRREVGYEICISFNRTKDFSVVWTVHCLNREKFATGEKTTRYSLFAPTRLNCAAHARTSTYWILFECPPIPPCDDKGTVPFTLVFPSQPDRYLP